MRWRCLRRGEEVRSETHDEVHSQGPRATGEEPKVSYGERYELAARRMPNHQALLRNGDECVVQYLLRQGPQGRRLGVFVYQ